ncbi:hypothetical protein KAU33_14315 [Candidatus Dependentiae bacterium]|nr:hypothetical protein [Candidatus Dependentiae bacterium]
MLYFDILLEFYKHKVRYLIVGGLSVNLYGIPRVTQDIDVIISTEKKNVEKIIRILSRLDYILKQPVDPIIMADSTEIQRLHREKNLIDLSFYQKNNLHRIIDIVLVHNVNFKEAFQNKVIKKAKDIEIYLAPIDDIIRMKKLSGRAQDIADIEMLEKLKKFNRDGN